MRLISIYVPIIMVIFLVACSSQTEEDLRPDCSQSDLEISNVQVTDAECNIPGSLTVTATGGSDGLSYSLGGTDFQESPTFEGLSAGNYTVVVMDIHECSVSSPVTVGINAGAILLSTDSKTASGCGSSNGSISLSASGGTGGYSYRINGGSFESTNEFTGLSQGSYTVEARDEAGCVSNINEFVPSGVSLETQIMPIINSNCALSGCHADRQSPLFTSSNAVRNNAARIQSVTSSGFMPPGGQPDLSQNQIDLISCWANDVAGI